MVLHRYGSVAEKLALQLLVLQPGDRLAPVGQLAEVFGTGRGTVQSALKILLQEGAVELENRGNLGSFVTRLDHGRLLQLGGISPLIGVMAVPYSLRFKGLATGLLQAFEQAGLPFVLAHLRGGKNRLYFLRTGRCDLAVISYLAWQEEAKAGDLRLALRFGPGSNVGDHVLMLRAGEKGITDGMRVGIDPSSGDHVTLTLEECRGRAVELVEISYSQVPHKLQAGEIDAAIWETGAPLPPDATLMTVALRPAASAGAADTEAVLVVRADADPLCELLQQRIKPEVVIDLQQRVLSGAALPVF